MERCDVLVVGGGPAGSSAARALTAAGFDVVVLDRRAFPRDKVCAGWITPPVFAELEIEAGHYAQGRVMQPLTGFRVGRMGDADVEVDLGRTVSYGIRRCEFDHFLLERCGARVMDGEGLRSLSRMGDHWVANERLAAPLLIGAGGHFCPVARGLSLRPAQPEPVVAAQEIEFELSEEQLAACPVRPEIPELYFCRDLRGYGWAFRKGRFLNVGLGRRDRTPLAPHVERFVADLARRGRIPQRLPGPMKGHAYLLQGQSPRPLLADGVLLVGDAAGLASDRAGEGIRPAVESGLLAARAVQEARGKADAAHLRSYARAIEERFGPRDPAPARGITAWLPAPLAGRLAGLALANRWFAARVVVERWFLQSQLPPLPASRARG